jgi:predicted TIM-barrel fold metal-dependent hydrolase
MMVDKKEREMQRVKVNKISISYDPAWVFFLSFLKRFDVAVDICMYVRQMQRKAVMLLSIGQIIGV